ncbi:MAG: VOC family protein [Saprospiraceae bacterium]
MNIKAGNLTIHVQDMDESIAFYQAIGFNLDNRWENHYAQMSVPGLIIGLHPSLGKKPIDHSGNLSIGLTCADFGKVMEELINLDIQVEERTEAGGRFIHFQSPEGTSMYFIDPKY